MYFKEKQKNRLVNKKGKILDPLLLVFFHIPTQLTKKGTNVPKMIKIFAFITG